MKFNSHLSQVEVLERMLEINNGNSGSYHLVEFKQGLISFEKAVFLITLCLDEKVVAKRKERRMQQKGCAVFNHRLKNIRYNIFGRMIRTDLGQIAPMPKSIHYKKFMPRNIFFTVIDENEFIKDVISAVAEKLQQSISQNADWQFQNGRPE